MFRDIENGLGTKMRQNLSSETLARFSQTRKLCINHSDIKFYSTELTSFETFKYK